MASCPAPIHLQGVSKIAARSTAALLGLALLLLGSHTAQAAAGALGGWLAGDASHQQGRTTQLRGRRSLLVAAGGESTTTMRLSRSCRRDQGASPYRLMYDTAGSGLVRGGGDRSGGSGGPVQKHCFRVEHVGSCDPRSTCCGVQQVLHQALFHVVPSCQPSLLKVTVDGREVVPEYGVDVSGVSVLRVPQLGKSGADAPGTEICLFIDASSSSRCPSLQALCGGSSPSDACKYTLLNQAHDCCAAGSLSSPSQLSLSSRPQRDSEFPHVNCQRDSSASRYYTTIGNSTAAGDDLTKICFDVHVSDVCEQPDSPCCSFELYKMEFEVDAGCIGALAYTSVDGKKRAPFFQSYPWPAIKVTNIDKPISTAAGTQVCLFLRPQCNTLRQLCTQHDGSCTVGLFDKLGRSKGPGCCPLSYLYQ